MSNKPKITLNYPVYPDLAIRNGGELPDEKGAYACWYYYTLAQKMYEKLGVSTEDQFGLLETDPWLDPHYVQLAWSVSQVFGLSNPDEFMRFRDPVAKQAKALKLPEPRNRYMNPVKLVIQ